jgi:hypothetical protein
MEQAKKQAIEYHGDRPCMDPEVIERIVLNVGKPKRATFLRWWKKETKK